MDINKKIIDDFKEKVVNHPEVRLTAAALRVMGFLNGNEDFLNCLKATLKMVYDLGSFSLIYLICSQSSGSAAVW